MSQQLNEKRSSVQMVRVSKDQAGQRIDNFLLARLKGIPKSVIYKLLRTGQVRVNKKRIKAVYRIAEGDNVRIPPVSQRPADVVTRAPQALVDELESRILLEDEFLMVVNKPSGLAVHKGSGLGFGLIDVLRQSRPNAPFLELVHRLDRETSGCLLIAKQRSVLNELHELIRANKVSKHYIALLDGQLKGKGRKLIRTPIEESRQAGQKTMRVSDKGKMAVSYFRPLRYYKDATLVAVELETGRTHQIRVQSAHLGHAVLGDSRYGKHELNREWKRRGLARLFLHASEVSFQLLVSGRKYAVKAPLDGELQTLLEHLSVER
jgi:23S rRNA pseudouridine955/2504/2580 synthase